MPGSFLPPTRRESYCIFPDALSSHEFAQYFQLDDDRDWIANKRRDDSRFGYGPGSQHDHTLKHLPPEHPYIAKAGQNLTCLLEAQTKPAVDLTP